MKSENNALDKLGALLTAAIGLIEPAQIVQREIMDNHRAQGLSDDGADKLLYGWRVLFKATQNTPYDPEETQQAIEAVALLVKIAQAVAKMDPMAEMHCVFCGCDEFGPTPHAHAADCGYRLMQVLRDGEEAHPCPR